MEQFIRRFSINCHSSIRCRCDSGTVLWFDPFRVADAPHDGDVIFVTHDHYDHLSPEDLRRVMKPGAVIVLPETCVAAAVAASFSPEQLLPVQPGGTYRVGDLAFETVPAYNINKKFHPAENRWVGYVAAIDGKRIYVAGDTDDTPEARAVRCDVAFLPAGGTYTTTAAEAAALAGAIRPALVIPTHYGSIVGKPGDAAAFAAALDSGINCVTLL